MDTCKTCKWWSVSPYHSRKPYPGECECVSSLAMGFRTGEEFTCKHHEKKTPGEWRFRGTILDGLSR
jgi:hypothetical protein